MVIQSLPPFHPPLLSHTIPSLPVTCLQGQVLLLSLAICSTQSVFLRSPTFAFLELCPKGEAIEQFAASMHLVLDITDKYPHDSLSTHILDVVAQFLPTLLMSCSRRDRVRQIVSNAKRFQSWKWKGLWETAVLFERKETDNTVQRSQTRHRSNQSIQTRVVYPEHCTRGGYTL